jgi:hypothetical protein
MSSIQSSSCSTPRLTLQKHNKKKHDILEILLGTPGARGEEESYYREVVGHSQALLDMLQLFLTLGPGAQESGSAVEDLAGWSVPGQQGLQGA